VAAWVVSEATDAAATTLGSTISNRSQQAAGRPRNGNPRETVTIVPEGIAMHMSGESLIIILLIGLAAGWLAAEFVEGTGFGLVGDVTVGVLGAFIGDWVMPRLGVYLGTGLFAAIANATVGAIVLLLVVKLFRGGGRWAGGWSRRWR
jgi:uncharacterized membrane protein YeaQ/YmgE (transglycosylase-associated protein family)